MIELGSSPELHEIIGMLQGLTRAVGAMAEVLNKNTRLLEYLAGSVTTDDPEEGQDLRKLIADLALSLKQHPAEMEAAVRRGLRAGLASPG